jgi:hypothetical protein
LRLREPGFEPGFFFFKSNDQKSGQIHFPPQRSLKKIDLTPFLLRKVPMKKQGRNELRRE